MQRGMIVSQILSCPPRAVRPYAGEACLAPTLPRFVEAGHTRPGGTLKAMEFEWAPARLPRTFVSTTSCLAFLL
jgi:hypothetical protein